MVEGEGQDAAGLQDAVRLAPALREQALVEAVGVFRLTCTVGDRLKRLGCVVGGEVVGVLVLQRETQPDVEEVRQFRIMQQAAEGWVSDDQIQATAGQ